MNGFSRSQFHLMPHYGGRQTNPCHTGYDTFVQPMSMPHSYFGRPTNELVNGYNFHQPSNQAPNAVQKYLDINCNVSGGNQDMVGYLILLPVGYVFTWGYICVCV